MLLPDNGVISDIFKVALNVSVYNQKLGWKVSKYEFFYIRTVEFKEEKKTNLKQTFFFVFDQRLRLGLVARVAQLGHIKSELYRFFFIFLPKNGFSLPFLNY